MELKFQSELSKIVEHYDSLTIAEEAKAVKILLGKINIPTVFNWFPVFNEMATGCDVPVPVSWHVSKILDDLEPARYPTVGL